MSVRSVSHVVAREHPRRVASTSGSVPRRQHLWPDAQWKVLVVQDFVAPSPPAPNMSLRRSRAPRASLAVLGLHVPHGSRGTTILIDLEGSYSTEREKGHDFRIFNVGFILSSVIPFNQKSPMNNAATLDMLECCTQEEALLNFCRSCC